jgi:hypothetical protein
MANPRSNLTVGRRRGIALPAAIMMLVLSVVLQARKRKRREPAN